MNRQLPFDQMGNGQKVRHLMQQNTQLNSIAKHQLEMLEAIKKIIEPFGAYGLCLDSALKDDEVVLESEYTDDLECLNGNRNVIVNVSDFRKMAQVFVEMFSGTKDVKDENKED